MYLCAYLLQQVSFLIIFLVFSPVTVQLGTLLSICGNQWPKWPEMKNHLPTLFQYLLSSTSGQGMEVSATWIQNKCRHRPSQLRTAVCTKGQSGSAVREKDTWR